MKFVAVVLKEGNFEPEIEEAQRVVIGSLAEVLEDWAFTIHSCICESKSIPELYGYSVPGGFSQESSKYLSLEAAKDFSKSIRPSDEWHIMEYTSNLAKYHVCIGFKKDDIGSDIRGTVILGHMIIMDRGVFIDSKFSNCTLVYLGGELPEIRNCEFNNCDISFKGKSENDSWLQQSFLTRLPNLNLS